MDYGIIMESNTAESKFISNGYCHGLKNMLKSRYMKSETTDKLSNTVLKSVLTYIPYICTSMRMRAGLSLKGMNKS
jgi:hypothetical protein